MRKICGHNDHPHMKAQRVLSQRVIGWFVGFIEGKRRRQECPTFFVGYGKILRYLNQDKERIQGT